MQQFKELALKLLQTMTVEEKVMQLASAWLEIREDGTFSVREYGKSNRNSGDLAQEILGKGIGQLSRPYGSVANEPSKQAKAINKVQHYLVTQTRLGIPAMIHEECLTGAMIKGATIFPAALNYGATWDPDMIEKVGSAIGGELRSLGVHQGLAPVLDVARDARWGRTEETFGEDPYLCGLMALSYVNGLQGKDCRPLATLKHFVGHSFSEGGRNHAPVHAGMREILNTFALPFEMVIRSTHVGSLMPAYHDIDGIPSSSNKALLTDLLRNQWGFDGLVVSDYEAIVQLFDDHQVANDMAEAAALTFNAGMDIELPGFTVFKDGLIEALYRGLISGEELDCRVLKVLEQKFRLGLFDHPYIQEDAVELGTSANHDLAREAAEKSLVLLKNDGTLPLRKGMKIALIGPLADHPYAMFGGYAPPIHLQGSHGPEQTVPAFAKTIKGALFSAVGAENVLYESGCMLYENKVERALFFPGDVEEAVTQDKHELSCDTSRIDIAVKTSLEADATVLVVGDLAGLFGLGTVGEGSDVSDLALPGVQEQLMRAVLDTGKPVAVVLVSGRPYPIEYAVRKASAILAAWLPGQGGGEAIARTLVGLNNPGGRSPLSFPRSAGAMPYFYNHHRKATGVPKQSEFAAIYPFGHGLSYTTFEWSDFTVEPQQTDVDGSITVSVTVTNTGDKAGDDVVQIYSRDVVASIVRPVKELKAFKRVHLEPGERKKLIFTLPVDLFSFIDEKMERVLESGSFELMIGKSCEQIVFRTQVSVVGVSKVFTGNWRLASSVSVHPLS